MDFPGGAKYLWRSLPPPWRSMDSIRREDWAVKTGCGKPVTLAAEINFIPQAECKILPHSTCYLVSIMFGGAA